MRMIPVRQKFPASPPLDVRAELRRQFRPSLKPGARIAVGVGSRGITNLAAVVAETVAILKAAGSSYDQVVRCTVVHRRMNRRDASSLARRRSEKLGAESARAMASRAKPYTGRSRLTASS